jgi:hypothetical protein
MTKTVAKKYEPTRQDLAAAEIYAERQIASPSLSPLNIQEVDGGIKITTDHPEPKYDKMKLSNALASTDNAFIDGIMKQLINAGSQGGGIDEGGVNYMVSVIKGVKPQDQLETMLAAQMAAVHNATMTYARRLSLADTLMEADAAERSFNKLARTFTTQMEALKRYRNGGEQKVTVQHVNVEDGGQAIVGNVQGGGGLSKKVGPTS